MDLYPLNTVILPLIFFEQGNNALISFEHMPVHRTAIVSVFWSWSILTGQFTDDV